MSQLTDNVARIAETVGRLGWYTWYRDNGDVDWSPGLRRLFGVPDEADATFELYVSMIHDEDRTAALARGAAAQADGKSFDSRYRIRRWDGSILWIRARGEACELDGRPVIIGVIVDMTDVVLRKQEIERTNCRLLDALEQSQKLIALMEANGLALPEL